MGEYILLNGETIALRYENNKDESVISKRCTCRCSHKHNAYTKKRLENYEDMTYNTRVDIGGQSYVFRFHNILIAEGFGVLAAQKCKIGDVYKILTLPLESLKGYAVNIDASEQYRRLQEAKEMAF